MATNPEYALMAGYAYLDTRNQMNWFPSPEGWTDFNHQVKASGFEAVSFQRGNEIVISFAGTDPEDLLGDVAADIALALGFGSDQLREAAAYYLEVRKANPAAIITFTGHSLGGGLAALMGVFFDRPAVTFDQAPFAASATVIDSGSGTLAGVPTVLLNYLRGLGYADYLLRPLETYIGLADRQHRVTGEYVQGEFLTSYPVVNWLSKIGNQFPLKHGANDVSGSDLHSQALLAAFVQNTGFQEVTKTLSDLGRMLFDGALYYHDPNDKTNPRQNFLENLLRHQIGVKDSITADAMLDRFTSDLQKIASDARLSVSGSDLTKALIAFDMQMYYEKNVVGKELFGKEDGGIYFDRADVADSLDAMKGYTLYFQNYLATLPSDVQQYASQMLADLQDWYIAGGKGMSATAGGGAAFMLGAGGIDNLTGGDGNDLLVGLENDDNLTGGKGDDILQGDSGTGNDLIDGQGGDGSVLTKNQLINALGIAPTGTPEADMLSGTALSETIRALADLYCSPASKADLRAANDDRWRVAA